MNQDLEQKIVNISKSPSSQEDLIQLTAEIGQQLLTRNTHLEEQLQFLSLKLEERNKYIEELLTKIDTEQNNSFLETIRRLENELDSLATKYEHAVNNHHNSEQQSLQLLDELRKQEEKVKRLATDFHDQALAKERINEERMQLEDEAHRCKMELERAETREREMKRHIQQLNTEKEYLNHDLKEMTEKMKLLEDKLNSVQKVLKLNKSNDNAATQIEELKKRNEKLESEKEYLNQTVQQLITANQRQRNEYEALLEDTRITLSALQASDHSLHQDELIEGSLNTSTSETSISPNNAAETLKISIFDELTKEIEREVSQRNKEYAPERVQEEDDDRFLLLPLITENLSPTEIYFYLCACAVKIKLTLHNSNLFDVHSFPLNCRALYQQAKKERTPFHEWHKWLKEVLNKHLTSNSFTQVYQQSVTKASSILVSPHKSRYPKVFNVTPNTAGTEKVAILRTVKLKPSNKSPVLS